MTSLTFLGGVGEIGGNKILLRNNNGAGAFLDFGANFAREGRFFEWPILEPYYLPDLFHIGALPEVPHLYRTSSQPSEVKAVFVSHPHADHYGYVPLLNGSVSVNAGPLAMALIELRLRSGDESWKTKTDHLTGKQVFRTGDTVQVPGTSIQIRPFAVDHSVPGAYAFTAETGGKRVAYTGDLRAHGTSSMQSRTREFIRTLEKEPVDVLVTEGTHLAGDAYFDSAVRLMRERLGDRAPRINPTPDSCNSEADVERELRRLVDENLRGRLVVAETNPVDFDRIRSLWRVARATGRTFVLQDKQAFFIYALQEKMAGRPVVLPKSKGDIELMEWADRLDPFVEEMPTPDSSAVFLKRHRMRADRRGDLGEDAEDYTAYLDAWERWLLSQAKQVFMGPEGRGGFRKDPGRFLVSTSNATALLHQLSYEMARPADLPLGFVLSKSEPFSEEMEISFEKLLHWLALYGVREVHQVHVSGHGGPDLLREVVEASGAKTVYPIHTERPEGFKEWHGNVVDKIVQGREYPI